MYDISLRSMEMLPNTMDVMDVIHLMEQQCQLILVQKL